MCCPQCEEKKKAHTHTYTLKYDFGRESRMNLYRRYEKRMKKNDDDDDVIVLLMLKRQRRFNPLYYSLFREYTHTHREIEEKTIN